MTICIIDYGSGNLHSVAKAFATMATPLGREVQLITDPQALASASHIVLPGVGAFGDCVAGLKAAGGMWDALSEAVLTRAVPFFGICVGMQMMLERGLEHGEHAGLGWVAGDVVPLRPQPHEEGRLRVPHMGWNELTITRPHPVLGSMALGDHVYFVHSYHARCTVPDTLLAQTDYGGPVTACIGKANMIGTQFHPEKSGHAGLSLIKNFIDWDGKDGGTL